MAAEPLAEEMLLEQALALIKQRLDDQKLEAGREYTFEYRYQDRVFVEVVSPRWWLPTSA